MQLPFPNLNEKWFIFVGGKFWDPDLSLSLYLLYLSTSFTSLPPLPLYLSLYLSLLKEYVQIR